MERSEKWKTLLCFGLFGCVVLGLSARLFHLQGGRSEPNRQSVRRARDLREALPAARGDIVDRHGERLAYDRITLEVRAEFQARVPKGTKRIPEPLIEDLATRLASHVVGGGGRAETRPQLAAKLAKRIRAARHKRMPSKFRTIDYLAANFLVCRDLDSHEAARRLRHEIELWRAKEMPGRLHLTFSRGYTRTYPERALTMGAIGNYYIASRKTKTGKTVQYEDFQGLEACRVLWAGSPGGGSAKGVLRGDAPHLLTFKDARRRRFWTGLGIEPQVPSRIHCTLDTEFQRLADAELRAAAATVKEKYKTSYKWGAMVLVDIPKGEILALASHYPDRPGVTPFAPVENAFEPGSVVKPLVLAMALQKGLVRWDEVLDCTPTRPQLGRPVDGHPRRIIKDDHRCGLLSPSGVISNSSNIGAVQIGVRLGPAGMQDYLRFFGLAQKTGLGLANEARGRGPEGGIDQLHAMDPRKFGRFTGPSLSFGYELNVTVVQLARAYLRLLSGNQRDLRLVRAVEAGGKRLEPSSAASSQVAVLDEDTIFRVKSAMTRVVSPDEHATGRHLYEMIRERGVPQPLVAGKTGTSDSTIGGIKAKTAAFVGFAPVDKPRYLVVCVLRKDSAVRFYGGSYAALPAGRLLLGALAANRKKSQPAPLKQVRAWSGGRGHSSKIRKSGGS